MTLYNLQSKPLYSRVALAVLFIYFLALVVPKLQDNLWNDEIYTLKKFTLVPLKTVVTDYHVPNNHIFYNLCDKIYLTLLGIQELKTVLEHPWILRLPLLFISLLTLVYTYRLGKLIGWFASGRHGVGFVVDQHDDFQGAKTVLPDPRVAGLMSLLILVTTIPFQNFCLQVRGYSFSMFFDVVLVFYAARYLLFQKKRDLLFIGLSCFAALYSIPLNLYCAIALALFLGAEILWQKFKEKVAVTKYLWVSGAIAAGVILAVLCYLPIYKQVTGNEYVKSIAPLSSHVVSDLFPNVFSEFLSGRVVLAALFLTSTIIYFFPGFQKKYNAKSLVIMLVLQVLTPFALIYTRGEQPPDRIFVYLTPLLCILLAATLVACIYRFVPAGLQWAALSAFVVYKTGVHQELLFKLRQQMETYVEHEARRQNLYCNYYQYKFFPLEEVHYLRNNGGGDKIPVLLKDSEPHDIPDYLNASGIPYYKFDSLDYYLNSNRQVYALTRFPSQIMDSTFLRQHNCTAEEVFKPGYHHVLKISSFKEAM